MNRRWTYNKLNEPSHDAHSTSKNPHEDRHSKESMSTADSIPEFDTALKGIETSDPEINPYDHKFVEKNSFNPVPDPDQLIESSLSQRPRDQREHHGQTAHSLDQEAAVTTQSQLAPAADTKTLRPTTTESTLPSPMSSPNERTETPAVGRSRKTMQARSRKKKLPRLAKRSVGYKRQPVSTGRSRRRSSASRLLRRKRVKRR